MSATAGSKLDAETMWNSLGGSEVFQPADESSDSRNQLNIQ